MGIKKHSLRKKAKEQTEENIIDLEDKKEKRRLERRAAAEQSRKKRGVKSLQQQMMEEVAAEDLKVEREAYVQSYSLEDIVTGKMGAAAASGRTERSRQKKGITSKTKIFIGVLIAIFIILGMSAGQIISLSMQRNEADEKLKLLQKEKANLELRVAEIGTDANIEKQARTWLKMTQNGETLYIIGDEQDTGELSGKEK